MSPKSLKDILLTFVICTRFTTASCQQVDLGVSFNSGLFSFAGPSAASSSSINFNEDDKSAYTNNPYGSKNGFCYGVSGNLKAIAKTGFIFGLDLGYEALKSKIAIETISTSGTQLPATGETFIHYDFINLFPFIGYRLAAHKKIFFDITAGLDNAICLTATEKGKATASDNSQYTTELDRKTITTDIRPRIQFSANYKRAGIYVGYSLGLRNYLVDDVGGTNECYSRMIRFGISYRLKEN